MIIKKSRLNEFVSEYNDKIGTDFEWEVLFEDTTKVQIYACDIETEEEEQLYGDLLKKYQID